MTVVLLLAAVLPALAIMWHFHSRDAFPEPDRLVWGTFGLSIASLIPAVLLALALPAVIPQPAEPWLGALYQAFGQAAIPEELVKFAVLYFFCFKHSEFDEPMDGFVYGAAASLGFAALENVLYVADSGLGTALLRALTAVPSHAMVGAVMGYFLALSRFRPDRKRLFFTLALIVPIALHGLYDFPLMFSSMGGAVETAFLTVLVLGVEYWVVATLLRRVRTNQEGSVILVNVRGLPNTKPQRTKALRKLKTIISRARGVHYVWEQVAEGTLHVRGSTSSDEIAVHLDGYARIHDLGSLSATPQQEFRTVLVELVL